MGFGFTSAKYGTATPWQIKLLKILPPELLGILWQVFKTSGNLSNLELACQDVEEGLKPRQDKGLSDSLGGLEGGGGDKCGRLLTHGRATSSPWIALLMQVHVLHGTQGHLNICVLHVFA